MRGARCETNPPSFPRLLRISNRRRLYRGAMRLLGWALRRFSGNEPKDISLASEGITDDAEGLLRNEPTGFSEAVAVVSDGADVEQEVVRNECGVVRSVRFDQGLTGAMRGAGQLLRPGISLRDAVRLGNRGGGGEGGSRRERRLRKKLSVVSS